MCVLQPHGPFHTSGWLLSCLAYCTNAANVLGYGGTYLILNWPRMQGSATLSMAYAAALFADSCLRGLNGEHCSPSVL